MDSLELARDMLTSINACEGLYIEEILGKYNGKCELPFILDTIAAALRREHVCAVDCLNGTKLVIGDEGKNFLNTICKEGRFEKIMALKKALFDVIRDENEEKEA